MCRDDDARAPAGKVFEHSQRQRRAFARIGVGGHLIDQHERSLADDLADVREGAQMGAKGRQIAINVLIVAHGALHAREQGQAGPSLGGNGQSGTQHQRA